LPRTAWNDTEPIQRSPSETSTSRLHNFIFCLFGTCNLLDLLDFVSANFHKLPELSGLSQTFPVPATSRDAKMFHGEYMAEGSLEVKLPTIWTDEKQRWEVREEKRREEKRREEKKKEAQKEKVSEERGSRRATR